MWQENNKKKIEKLKGSIFIVNKLHYLAIFLLVAVTNGTLAFYSFLTYIFIYLWNILTARLPISNRGNFEYITKVYKTVEDNDLKVDIWYPNQSKESYPLVVFAHGGGWVSGFRNQPNNISWCRYLAANGFAAASIDYRYGIKNQMQDILLHYDHALSYLKDNAKELKICPKKIILMGLSAGGHLSLLYASYYSYKADKKRLEGICGVVSYYAPSDLKDLISSKSRSLFAKFATITTLKDKKKKTVKYYSPISWISEKMLPVLIVHGKEDRTVPFSSSTKLAGKLKEFGVTYKFLVHPKGEHCFEMSSKDLQTTKILRTTIKWMKDIIKET